MHLYTKTYPLSDIAVFKHNAIAWAESQYQKVCYFDSNEYPSIVGKRFDSLIAIGSEAELNCNSHEGTNVFERLYAFHQLHQSWLFGYLGYDLKNNVEQLQSDNFDGLGFDDLHFFVAKYILQFDGGNVTICSKENNCNLLFEIIKQYNHRMQDANFGGNIKARVSKEVYLDTIQKIRQHIIEGDIYEMNFCQEYYAENCNLTAPYSTFQKLNALTKAPFSVYFRNHHQYLMCASPERFLQKKGNKLISQPIKGTLKKGQSEDEDETLRAQLKSSIKDRAEHVMIVDLVRNDLARSSRAGSVQVDELFGIYSFKTVHQMISTISSTIADDKTWADALRNAFPMGSMTGAPKVMSMQLIEQYEHTRRGLYSGAVGYITPDGDFDFNVVIRSILYNADKRYLSFSVGGAIVYDSEPIREYEECLLKANAMQRALANETE